MLTACWEVLKERKLSVPEDVALITYQNDNVPVDYPAVYFNFSVFQLAVEILNICNKSEPQKKFVNADFHCIEYLKKSSVFKKSESLKKLRQEILNSKKLIYKSIAVYIKFFQQLIKERRKMKKQKMFTLIELLVVIAIIAILRRCCCLRWGKRGKWQKGQLVRII